MRCGLTSSLETYASILEQVRRALTAENYDSVDKLVGIIWVVCDVPAPESIVSNARRNMNEVCRNNVAGNVHRFRVAIANAETIVSSQAADLCVRVTALSAIAKAFVDHFEIPRAKKLKKKEALDKYKKMLDRRFREKLFALSHGSLPTDPEELEKVHKTRFELIPSTMGEALAAASGPNGNNVVVVGGEDIVDPGTMAEQPRTAAASASAASASAASQASASSGFVPFSGQGHKLPNVVKIPASNNQQDDAKLWSELLAQCEDTELEEEMIYLSMLAEEEEEMDSDMNGADMDDKPDASAAAATANDFATTWLDGMD